MYIRPDIVHGLPDLEWFGFVVFMVH